MFGPEEILTRLREQPFTPLRIVTASGMTYDIRHPDQVWVGDGWLMIGIPHATHAGILHAANRVALFHVTELQDLPALKSGGNGPSS